MAIPKNLKKGTVIRVEGQPFLVVDYWEAKTAQRRATLHVKLKDLGKGKVIERTLDDKAEVDVLESSARTMQYLYSDRTSFTFMDTQTYDQVTIPREQMGADDERFLLPEGEYRVLFLESQPLQVELPASVSLSVTETSPAAKGGSSGGSVYKDAVLQTGLEVKVPLFIKIGDVVRISPETREYLGKENE